jgi:hypothetical protein
MAQESDSVMPGVTGGPDADSAVQPASPDTREIRSRIEQTRAEMTQTIGAIQERLSPSRIMSDATQSLKNETVGRVKRLAERGRTAMRDVQGRSWGAEDVVLTIRNHPIPAIVAGIGVVALTMLAAQRRRNPDRGMALPLLLIGGCVGVTCWSATQAREVESQIPWQEDPESV